MRAVVLAYHEIGYVCLEELLAAGVDVAALFTHKDDPDEEVWFRTPRMLAVERGIPVYDPHTIRDPAWIELVRSLEPDFLFSFYYRLMLPAELLDIPRVASLNLHGSLLPKFRGRCPVNWVLIEGETRTGLTLHRMEVKPDAGYIVAQKAVDILFEDTAFTLFMKLAKAARELMREVIPALQAGTFERRPQEGTSSYYGGRGPEDGRIDWTKGALALYNLVRAVTHPYPGAFTYLEGKKLYLWKAKPVEGPHDGPPGTVLSSMPLLVNAGEGALELVSLQLEGEEEIEASAFVARHPLNKQRLGGIS